MHHLHLSSSIQWADFLFCLWFPSMCKLFCFAVVSNGLIGLFCFPCYRRLRVFIMNGCLRWMIWFSSFILLMWCIHIDDWLIWNFKPSLHPLHKSSWLCWMIPMDSHNVYITLMVSCKSLRFCSLFWLFLLLLWLKNVNSLSLCSLILSPAFF